MLKFDNTHIFTSYLKQLLSDYNLPTCKVYTKEFSDYAATYGKEDPRVIESFDTIEYTYLTDVPVSKKRIAARINYLHGNELYNYFWDYHQNKQMFNHNSCAWQRTSDVFYNKDRRIPGLTKTLKSTGNVYDTATHEHLGDYLRFMRDYYGINLMPLYNCFNNKICNNIYYKHKITSKNPAFNKDLGESLTNKKYIESYRLFNAHDSDYRIYAFPVKLFSNYTIAIDCDREIEMFCGFYKTALDGSEKSVDLMTKTYKKVNRSFFRQPFLFDKLDVKYWNFERDSATQKDMVYPNLVDSKIITRWDIANREQDLKLFLKVPVSCKSSIVVLEGNFTDFNNFKYDLNHKGIWEYKQNHSVLNFDREADINGSAFKPISKLQLLAFNTGYSYPFADRLIEYLSNSTITPIDEIADNIKRAQKVMSQNNYYFKIDGLWEDKMQKIIYDYMINSGPVETVHTTEGVSLVDKRTGYHPRLGHTSKSTLFDVLGYVDREAEKWYSSWTIKDGKASIQDSVQSVDIYDGLYDI